VKDREGNSRTSPMKRIRRVVVKTIILIAIASLIMPVTGCSSSNNGKKTTDEIPRRPGVGDIITMGGYEWLVLSIEDHRALLITKDVIDYRPYDEEWKPLYSNTPTPPPPWKETSICRWLNREFLSTFADYELARITDSYLDGDEVNSFRVFLLSAEAVEKYLPTTGSRVAHMVTFPQGPPVSWMLRRIDRAATVPYSFTEVDEQGNLSMGLNPNLSGGVRPALWLQVD